MTNAQAAPQISYDHGVSDKKLIGETIGTFFDRIVDTYRDREALVVKHQNIRWTWGEFGRRVDDLAAGLTTLGLERGDRIGIWSPNTAEWALTQFATAKAGLVLVNVNPAYRRAELEYAMNKVECKALVLAPQLKTSNYLEIVEDLVKDKKLPHLEHIVRLGKDKTPGMLNFDDVAAAGGNAEKVKLAEFGPKLQFDDAINVQFTSGTTGFPKGATLSHHNILNNGYFVAEGLKLTENDRLCIPVPLYHCFGMVMGNLGCLTHGATMVYPAEAFDPLATTNVQLTSIADRELFTGPSGNPGTIALPVSSMESITVTARPDDIINPNRTGSTSTVSTEQIQTLPTVNRSLQDFARTNPYFTVDARDDSQTTLNVAGRNNRYNNIQIDGAVNNDLFGLAATGTPGGQANTQPISIDAIEQIQLVVSPYDVRQGGFTGGGVNVVTRSGMNKFAGSLYGTKRNESSLLRASSAFMS